LAAFIVSVHVPVPPQAPVQPVKADPVVGLAVRVTLVPLANVLVQVVPQSMPLRSETIVPTPLPLLATVRVYPVWLCCTANVAVTLRAAVMLTAQVPVPVQAPLQPAKVEPAAGVAVNVTEAPLV
jgi:hypothetical protein